MFSLFLHFKKEKSLKLDWKIVNEFLKHVKAFHVFEWKLEILRFLNTSRIYMYRYRYRYILQGKESEYFASDM